MSTLQLPSVRHGSQWRKKARALAWTCCLLWTVESPRLRHAGRGGLFTLPSIPGRPSYATLIAPMRTRTRRPASRKALRRFPTHESPDPWPALSQRGRKTLARARKRDREPENMGIGPRKPMTHARRPLAGPYRRLTAKDEQSQAGAHESALEAKFERHFSRGYRQKFRIYKKRRQGGVWTWPGACRGAPLSCRTVKFEIWGQ